jgi:hypothetical protein
MDVVNKACKMLAIYRSKYPVTHKFNKMKFHALCGTRL